MRKFCPLVLFLLALSGAAFGSPINCDTVTTAAALQALGSSGCQFGDKIFYDFSYSYVLQDSNGNIISGDANDPAVSAAEVSVSFGDFGGSPYAPVITFTASPTWQVAGGNSGDIRILYQVQAPAPNNAFQATGSATGSLTNVDPANQFAPYIAVAESLSVNGQAGGVNFGFTLNPPGTTTPSPVTENGSSDASFANSSIISVSKDVFLSSGTGGNEAILSQIDQGLFEDGYTPEPLSAFLLGCGLVGLGMLGRTKMKRKR